MKHPLLDLGGRGPLLHLAPANGFPPATYLPALAPVLETHHVVSLPPRAMWPAVDPPASPPGSWEPLAGDLLEGIGRHRLPPLVAVGHSFGAVVSLLAAVRDPARFRALAMLDPVIFPLQMLRDLSRRREAGEPGVRPLVEGALKRRSTFTGEAEAFGYWRAKPLFADWSDEAVRRYARAMLWPDGAGGFTLRWSPRWEAHYYASVETGSWDAIARLDPGLPVLIVRGATSDTFYAEVAEELQQRLPHATVRTVAGRGHLFPQSDPRETGHILSEWLSGLAPPPR